MGCCQQMPVKEKEQPLLQQTSMKFDFSPKTIQLEPFSLNLIKGDIDGVDLDKMDRMGSTCVDNVLIERLQSKIEKQISVQSKNEVIIDLRHASSPTQLIKDKSSRNLNNKFIGML